MPTMGFLIFAIFFSFCSQTSAQADVIRLKNGMTFEGTVVGETSDTITIEMGHEYHKFWRAQVERIVTGDEAQNIEFYKAQIKESEKRGRQYPEDAPPATDEVVGTISGEIERSEEIGSGTLSIHGNRRSPARRFAPFVSVEGIPLEDL